MQNKTALIIFSKVPVAGRVKTRLIKQFGKSYSATIYRRLLSETLHKATLGKFDSIQLWLDGDLAHPELTRILNQFDIETFTQHGNDLGERMSNAFKSTLMNFNQVVLIGCDCKKLEIDDMNLAVERLQESDDVVLGPTEDGGYYLIALKQPNPTLFEGIEWGTDTVLSKTINKIQEQNLNYFSLEQYSDIDTPDDVERELFTCG